MIAQNINLFKGRASNISVSIQAFHTRKNQSSNSNINEPNTYYLMPHRILYSDIKTFLVIGYYDPNDKINNKDVFISSTNMEDLKGVLRNIKRDLQQDDLIVQDTGIPSVNPKYADFRYVTNIGAQNKFLVFSIKLLNDGQGAPIKSVVINYPDTNGQSVLTEDEFYSMYGEIMDLNLTTAKLYMLNSYISAGYVNFVDAPNSAQQQFNQPQQQNYSRQYNQPQQQNYSRQYNQPQQQNYSRQYNQPQQQYQRPSAPQQQYQRPSAPQPPQNNYPANSQYTDPQSENPRTLEKNGVMPPRPTSESKVDDKSAKKAFDVINNTHVDEDKLIANLLNSNETTNDKQ